MFASRLNIRLRSLATSGQLWPPPINTDPDNINNSGEFVCCGDINVGCGLTFLIKAARKTSVQTNERVWEPLRCFMLQAIQPGGAVTFEADDVRFQGRTKDHLLPHATFVA